MRWLALLIPIFATFVASAAEKLQSQYLYGKSYVNLADWAQAGSFDMVWKPRQTLALLTNRWTKLKFTVDSPIASVNGVNVWLCYPVVLRGNGIFVAEKDIQKTLDPILFPPKAKAGQQIRTVAISAGHGGRDPGYVGGATTEKEQTLLLALELRNVLQSAGLTVFMTRSDDRYFTPEDKAAMSARAKADLFINLHFNQATPIIKGVETYALPPAGVPSTAGEFSSKVEDGNAYDHRNALLAYHIHKSVVERFDVVDRGVRRARFIVLREAKMPSVLLEAGFLSNREEAARIKDPKQRKELALAIHDGIMAYKKLVERGLNPETLPLPPASEAPKSEAKSPPKLDSKPANNGEVVPDLTPLKREDEAHETPKETREVPKSDLNLQPKATAPKPVTNAPPLILQSRVPTARTTNPPPKSPPFNKR